MLFVNIYPPVFEIPGTYHEEHTTNSSGKDVIVINKYYLVQTPPNYEAGLIDMVRHQLSKNDEANTLLKQQIEKNPDKDIRIDLQFCKKSNGIHRFWRAGRWDDILAYSDSYIILYSLSYSNGTCEEEFKIFNPLLETVETNTFKYEAQ